MKTCLLFFHGPSGEEQPLALGRVEARSLEEASTFMKAGMKMSGRTPLVGTWCCTFSDLPEDDTAALHPASCQIRFTLTEDGRIARPMLLQ